MSNAELQNLMHLSRREISAEIHRLREEGMIICADVNGYYIPTSNEELLAGYDNLWKKAVTGLAALRVMRREIKNRGLYMLTSEYKSRKEKRK